MEKKQNDKYEVVREKIMAKEKVLFKEFLSAVAPEPVSYTHLDVYKRQPLYRRHTYWDASRSSMEIPTCPTFIWK